MDPVLLAIATAAAGKGAESLADGARELLKMLSRALRSRFGDGTETREALEEARDSHGGDEGANRALARCLETAAQDPEVGRLLEELRPHFEAGDQGGVHNTIHGDVRDGAKVVQARDLHGPVNL